MTDEYWNRLAEGHRALIAAGADGPDMRAHDAALAARLIAPVPAEETYEAPDVHTENVTVEHDTGQLGVRVYTPPGSPRVDRPLFVWAHGGGWAAGDLEGGEADATSREVCSRADCIVASVDYRLATHGVHYPVPLDDVVAAFAWALSAAARLGADAANATLGGASAGGNLAAGAALRLRDQGSPTPARLVLVYPLVHPELPPALPELAGKIAPLSPSMASASHLLEPIVENYLGAPVHQADGYAMPGVASSLSGLPPTLIINSEYDGLRASGEAFATQLLEAGVDVQQRTTLDVAHGHLARPGHPAAAQTHAQLAAWVSGQDPQ